MIFLSSNSTLTDFSSFPYLIEKNEIFLSFSLFNSVVPMLSLESKCCVIPKIENFLKKVSKMNSKEEEDIFVSIFICNNLKLSDDEKFREKFGESKILELLLDILEMKNPFTVQEIVENYVFEILCVVNEFIPEILGMKGGDRLKSVFDVGFKELDIHRDTFYDIAAVLSNISPNLTFATNWDSFDFSDFFQKYKELILIEEEESLALIYHMAALSAGFVNSPSKLEKDMDSITSIVNTMTKHLGKTFEVPIENRKYLLNFMVILRNNICPWMNAIFRQTHQILKKKSNETHDYFFVIWMVIQLVDSFGESMETNISSPGFLDLIFHYTLSKDVKISNSAISLLQVICDKKFKIIESYLSKILVLHKFNPEKSSVRVV
jgi:hypothetical protein